MIIARSSLSVLTSFLAQLSPKLRTQALEEQLPGKSQYIRVKSLYSYLLFAVQYSSALKVFATFNYSMLTISIVKIQICHNSLRIYFRCVFYLALFIDNMPLFSY